MLYVDAQDADHITYLDARVRTPYVKRAPRRLNLQRTSLMLSVFAHSFTLLSFSNSVLAKLTINTFTGMCPAVSCGFQSYPLSTVV